MLEDYASQLPALRVNMAAGRCAISTLLWYRVLLFAY